MALHKLKTHPQYFRIVKNGIKEFECRKDDRGFKVGDELLLEEWVPDPINEKFGLGELVTVGTYTGEILHRRIKCILRDFEGIQPGFVILGLENL